MGNHQSKSNRLQARTKRQKSQSLPPPQKKIWTADTTDTTSTRLDTTTNAKKKKLTPAVTPSKEAKANGGKRSLSMPPPQRRQALDCLVLAGNDDDDDPNHAPTPPSPPSAPVSNHDKALTQYQSPLPTPPAAPVDLPPKSPKKNRTASLHSSTSTLDSSLIAPIDDFIERLLDAGYRQKPSRKLCLSGTEIELICHAAMDIFLDQPSLLELSPPVKIVGDTHGQFSDLLRLFQMSGFPPASNYLFLGDYVDRGKQSLETMLLLLCYKIKYPETFFLLRGNHENQNITKVYGFYDECKRRLNVRAWRTFINVFNTLPIAALVGDKIFCVHGGLSPDLTSLDDIRSIERPTDVPDFGLLNDLLWSDPTDATDDWHESDRGVSYCFGKNVLKNFLASFDLDLVCRAHMVVEDGYEFFNDRTLVTIFSAPNYCGQFDNLGAVMSVDHNLMCSFQLLTPANHPLCKTKAHAAQRDTPLIAQAAEGD